MSTELTAEQQENLELLELSKQKAVREFIVDTVARSRGKRRKPVEKAHKWKHSDSKYGWKLAQAMAGIGRRKKQETAEIISNG